VKEAIFTVREIIEVKDKYNITITKAIRRVVPIEKGQLVEIYTVGKDRIVISPLPKDPSNRLREMMKEIDKNFLRKEAEKISVSEAEKSLSKKI